MITREEARAQAESLVVQMTLEEKASQLRYDAPAIPRLGIPAYNWWNEALHGVARSGTATVFPQAIGLAAMWSEETLKRIAETISTEGRAKYNGYSAMGDRDIYKGLSFWSPNINIFRDPRWGRGHETYGEDPYLTARLAVRFIRGLQGDGKYLKCAACAKHFAVHSGPEAVRHEFDAEVSPKDLAETYLPAFEAAVTEGHVEAIMGAYNRVNGEPACGSKKLLTELLREKWEFDGHVVSDCGAIYDFHTKHMVTDTAPQSAALALKSGCDLNCGNTYLHLLEAYQEGLVTENDITQACLRVFTTRCMLGLFADDCEYDRIPFAECDTFENNALALEAAEKAMVLLKNNGVLPLDKDKIRTLAVIGPNADSIPVLEGNYCGKSSRNTTFLEGIRAYCDKNNIRVMYAKGCAINGDTEEAHALPYDRLSEARLCAANADIVIACVGLDPTLEGEWTEDSDGNLIGDKPDLQLPLCQQKLLQTLTQCGKPMVTVLSTGSALNVSVGDAILLTWYPGQAGGTALARILFGETNPSGKLPITFYKDLKDLPDFTDYSMKGRTYRYYSGVPLYPFGFGISYSRFSVVSAEFIRHREDSCVIATVQNDGPYDGETVIEVYVRSTSEYAPANAALCGFGRVYIPSEGSARIEIPLSRNTFTVVNSEGMRISDGQEYILYVGISQPDVTSCKMSGTRPIELSVSFE